jgi:hypothetical protein
VTDPPIVDQVSSVVLFPDFESLPEHARRLLIKTTSSTNARIEPSFYLQYDWCYAVLNRVGHLSLETEGEETDSWPPPPGAHYYYVVPGVAIEGQSCWHLEGMCKCLWNRGWDPA